MFETAIADKRTAIPHDPAAVGAFLREAADGPELTMVTNHVVINETDRLRFDHEVAALLRMAQQICQPQNATNWSACRTHTIPASTARRPAPGS